MRSISFISILLVLGLTWPLSAQLDQELLGNANEIVESEGTLELVSEQEARYTERHRITILNAESRANLFYVFYDPDNKILDLDADIYNITGEPVRKVRKSEIRDEAAVGGASIYTENRVKYIELNHAEYPYILEFTYTQRLKGISLASMPNWYFQKRSSSAVKSSKFTVVVPKNLDFQHQLYNLDADPQIWESGGKTTYHWSAQNLPAYSLEPYSPPYHEQAPILRLTPARFKIDDYQGSMESWDAYGEFLHELWRGRDQLPPDLANEIQELTADAATTDEKIARVYRHMQENKRYVSVQLGIGGWQPFSASYVEEHGYGDCKALSNYMKSALQVLGIESYPVIVEASHSRPYEVEDDFVDPDFNHAILYVPKEDMWLECTSPINPAGYLGRFTNNRRVLLVTPEGGRLAWTPNLGPEENVSQEALMVRLAADGSAELDYRAEMHGIMQESWRRNEYYLSKEEVKDRVRRKGKLPTMTLDEVALESDPDQARSELAFTASTKRYAARAGKRLFVPLNVICPRTKVPDPVENRGQPVVVSYGYTESATMDFQLPAGYRVESLPKATDLDTPFGRYSLSVEEIEGGVRVERNFVLLDDEQPAESYTEFREFLQQVVKSDATKMVLVSE